MYFISTVCVIYLSLLGTLLVFWFPTILWLCQYRFVKNVIGRVLGETTCSYHASFCYSNTIEKCNTTSAFRKTMGKQRLLACLAKLLNEHEIIGIQSIAAVTEADFIRIQQSLLHTVEDRFCPFKHVRSRK